MSADARVVGLGMLSPPIPIAPLRALPDWTRYDAGRQDANHRAPMTAWNGVVPLVVSRSLRAE